MYDEYLFLVLLSLRFCHDIIRTRRTSQVVVHDMLCNARRNFPPLHSDWNDICSAQNTPRDAKKELPIPQLVRNHRYMVTD